MEQSCKADIGLIKAMTLVPSSVTLSQERDK